MVDEVDSCGIGETHFPSTRQGTQLRNWLLLDCSISTTGVLCIHADELLSTGIDPGSGASIMIDEIGTAFRGISLLPASG